MSQKELNLISRNAAIMCDMYTINEVHGPEPRSSGGNTSSNPQDSALIPRPAFNGMERMCQRHGSNQNSYPPVLVRKPLCNQFIHCHISSRGFFGINHFKLGSFAVVAIECSWSEHPSYCRTTVGIRPLGFLSAVGFCKPHHTTSPHHLPSLFAKHWAYSTSNTLI